MTPRRFKCTQFHEGTLDFSLECIKLLQNDFFKQRYITFNAIIPGQDRIYPNTHLCRTFFAGYIYPCKPQFYYVKVGCKTARGVLITQTCYPDELGKSSDEFDEY